MIRMITPRPASTSRIGEAEIPGAEGRSCQIEVSGMVLGGLGISGRPALTHAVYHRLDKSLAGNCDGDVGARA